MIPHEYLYQVRVACKLPQVLHLALTIFEGLIVENIVKVYYTADIPIKAPGEAYEDVWWGSIANLQLYMRCPILQD